MTKRTLVVALAGSAVLVTGALALAPPAAKRTEEKAAPSVSAAVTRVYYFHGNYRCATCKTIEAYAHETLTSAFAKDLEAQRIAWQVVNVDEAANKHFVADYQLYTRSLVVVDGKDPKRFKVLDRVWELARDKAAFHKYVEQEVRGFGRS